VDGEEHEGGGRLRLGGRYEDDYEFLWESRELGVITKVFTCKGWMEFSSL
jgi:hypothetical protein